MVDEAEWNKVRHIWGRPLDAIVDRWPLITYYLLDLADEARELIARTGIVPGL